MINRFIALTILLFALTTVKSASAAEWGTPVTVPGYPGLEVRVGYTPESILNYPHWLVDIKNNYDAEIYIAWKLTEYEITLTSTNQLNDAAFIQPGEWLGGSGDVYLNAEANDTVLVWLGNLRINGVLQDPVGLQSVSFGAETGSVGSGSGNPAPDPVLPPPSADPCASSIPAFSTQLQSISIPATTTVGTSILTVSAQNPGCNLTYSLASTPDVYYFSISNSGEIVLNNALPVDPINHPGFNIRAIANNGYWSAFSEIQITMIGSPQILISPEQTFFLRNTALAGQLIGQVSSQYYEGDQPTVQYSIVGGNPNNLFSINSITGQLTVTNEIVLRSITTQTSFPLSIQGTDGIVTGFGNISVIVSTNDAPILNNSYFSIPKVTNQPIIGQVVGFDPDSGPNALSYSILSGNELNIFKMDNIGRLFVFDSKQIQDSNQLSYTLRVRVSDGFQSGDADINISINPNNLPVLDTSPISGEVNRNRAPLPGAFDLDNNRLFYSIVSGNDAGIFEIDNNSLHIIGDIAQATYSLGIQVSDGLGIDSGIVDVNFSNAPILSESKYYFSMPFANARANATVGVISATDVDTPVLTYAMGTPSGWVNIEAASGRVFFFTIGLNTYDWDLDSYGLKMNGISIDSLTVTDGTFTDSASAHINFLAPFNNLFIDQGDSSSFFYPWAAEECGPTMGTLVSTKDWTKPGEIFRYEFTDQVTYQQFELEGRTIRMKGNMLPIQSNFSIGIQSKVTDTAGQQWTNSGSVSFSPTRVNQPAEYYDYDSCVAGIRLRGRYPLVASQGSPVVSLGAKELVIYEINLAEAGVLQIFSNGNVRAKGLLLDANGVEQALVNDSVTDNNLILTSQSLPAGIYSLKVQNLSSTEAGTINVTSAFTATDVPVVVPPTGTDPASSSQGGGGIVDIYSLMLLLSGLVLIRRKIVPCREIRD